MNKEDQIYSRLQKHLDKQVVGFPATRSGAEIRLLKRIFTPEEAEVAACLGHKPESVESMFKRTGHLCKTTEDLTAVLDRIQKKGGIGAEVKDGKKHYFSIPFVVGIYELQVGTIDKEFVEDFDEYTAESKFGLEILSTELPQMRTIPVNKSIKIENKVSTFDEVSSIIEQAEEPFVIIECICRKKKRLEDKPCEVTSRDETCLAIGNSATAVLGTETGRLISRGEALSILEENQKEGLVLQPSNTQKVDFICSCCGCCCGMLSAHQKLPKPLNFWVSNFHAAVDAEVCTGCGICEKRCQVRAIRVSAEKNKAVVGLNRCLGCGVCVTTCPVDAISLIKKPNEIKPPETIENLYDIIRTKKKNKFQKLMLVGKLIFDAICTGQLHLLKK